VGFLSNLEDLIYQWLFNGAMIMANDLDRNGNQRLLLWIENATISILEFLAYLLQRLRFNEKKGAVRICCITRIASSNVVSACL
jgi:hypothetical protein